jgi:hypothetical protein
MRGRREAMRGLLLAGRTGVSRARLLGLATALVLCLAAVSVALALPTVASAEVCPNASSRSGLSASLPDCRVYEMVTPPDNENANIYVAEQDSAGGGAIPTERPFQAAADGDAVAYVGDPTSGGNGSSGGGGGNEYLATRSPAGGWTQLNIEPPGYDEAIYQAFSSDLSIGLLASFEEPALSPAAPGGGYDVLYSRTNDDGGYHPLFTTTPPNREPSEFGAATIRGGITTPEISVGPPLYAGASANLSHLLFEANDALAATPNALDGGTTENNLYDSVGGQLSLVNVLPDGAPAPDASFGSPIPLHEENAADFSHVISADGSRVFWTDLNTHDLYVRENDATADATTAQVDAAEPGCLSEGKCVSGGGWFWAASGDGSKVFFTDCNRLASDSSAVSGGGCGEPKGIEALTGNDLYEYELNPVASQPGVLRDLTVDHNAGDALGADVQGVIGASEDGEYVYFVADGVLADENVEQRAPTRGDPNLYEWHDGVTTFIATLAPEDNFVRGSGGGGGVYGDWQSGLGYRTAEVAADGRGVVFMSHQSLTGYDNVGQSGPMEEVFVYDTGRLVCASCSPSGEPLTFTASDAPAAFLPANASDTYQPRWISDERPGGGEQEHGIRVFFDSSESLVSAATDDRQNVYEWEQDGVGSCQSGGGCVYLLSGGTSGDYSYLIDASASGDDVFINTRAQLAPQDQDENFNVFDVRVGGVQPASAPACSETGCQGVPSAPPLFATPPSATFNGVGNFEPPAPTPAVKPKAKPLTQAQKLASALKACRKKPKKQRAGCEAQAKKRYGSRSKAKKSADGGERHV